MIIFIHIDRYRSTCSIFPWEIYQIYLHILDVKPNFKTESHKKTRGSDCPIEVRAAAASVLRPERTESRSSASERKLDRSVVLADSRMFQNIDFFGGNRIAGVFVVLDLW